MLYYTEDQIHELLKKQREICRDRALIDYAEPDKLMLLIQAPEPDLGEPMGDSDRDFEDAEAKFTEAMKQLYLQKRKIIL